MHQEVDQSPKASCGRMRLEQPHALMLPHTIRVLGSAPGPILSWVPSVLTGDPLPWLLANHHSRWAPQPHPHTAGLEVWAVDSPIAQTLRPAVQERSGRGHMPLAADRSVPRVHAPVSWLPHGVSALYTVDTCSATCCPASVTCLGMHRTHRFMATQVGVCGMGHGQDCHWHHLVLLSEGLGHTPADTDTQQHTHHPCSAQAACGQLQGGRAGCDLPSRPAAQRRGSVGGPAALPWGVPRTQQHVSSGRCVPHPSLWGRDPRAYLAAGEHTGRMAPPQAPPPYSWPYNLGDGRLRHPDYKASCTEAELEGPHAPGRKLPLCAWGSVSKQGHMGCHLGVST
jgi:hypothetical protein